MKFTRTLKFAASIKDVVQKYKLDDPFLLFFLTKYEPLIPWKDIKTAEDINKYIKSALLPELKNKIDPKSDTNNYLKDINIEREFEFQAGDPQIQQIKEVYQKNPEEAKQQRLDHLNRAKQEVFDEWWNELIKDETYSQSPSFIYSILRPIIDRSPDTDKRTPSLFNEEALNSIYEKIRDEESWKQPFKVDKVYDKKTEEIHQRENLKQENFEPDKDNPGNGWLRIPSKINNPKEFEENVQKLMEYSNPNGWCTGGEGLAKSYLGEGDFWLYLINGRAQVAVKLIDPNNRVDQIRGPQNKVPYENWEAVVSLFENKHLDKTSYTYQEIAKAQKTNEEFESNPSYRNKILEEASSGNFKNIEQLTKANRNEEDVKGALQKGWIIKLSTSHSNPYLYELVPQDFLSNPEIFKILKTKWLEYLGRYPDQALKKNIPRAIKRTPEFQVALVGVVMDRLRSGIDKDVLKNLPQNWRKNPDMVKAVKEGWIKGFEKNPSSQEKILQSDIDIAEEFKNDPDVLNARKEGWATLVSRQLSQFDQDYFPQDLKNDEDILKALRDGYAKALETKPMDANLRLKANERFPNDPEIKQGIKNGILQYLQKAYKPPMVYPHYGLYPETLGIPEEFKNDPEIKTMQKGIIMGILRQNPFEAFTSEARGVTNVEIFPVELQNDPDILGAQKEGIIKKVLKDPGVWDDNKQQLTAKGLINDPDIIKNTKKGWIRKIKESPLSKQTLNRDDVDPDSFMALYMQDDPSVKNAQKDALISFIGRERSVFDDYYMNHIRRFPEAVRSMPEVGKAYKEAVAKRLLAFPWEISEPNCPEKLKSSPYIQKAVQQGLLNALDNWTNNPTNYIISPDWSRRLKQIPSNILAMPEIIQAYKRALAALVQSNPWEYESPNFPKKLMQDPAVLGGLEQRKQQWINTFTGFLEEGERTKDEIAQEIQTNRLIPPLIRTDLMNWLNNATLNASKNNWYRHSYSKK